ncbi:MAG: hypothetical protein WCP09_03445 [Candidatus Taylorbacteria bacterium]
MSSWSKNRKSLYGGSVIVALLVLIIVPLYLNLYKAPTCFDNIQNGTEQDVDCGGSCEKLCQNSFFSPLVKWTRFEKVAPGIYNEAAYIINPNTEGEAVRVPYHIALYDDKGVIITDKNGFVTLPPHRNTLAFQGNVSVGSRIPAKALFEFTGVPNWHKKSDPLSKLTITEKKYVDDTSGSTFSVLLNNEGIMPLQNISVYVVLSDKDGNALGFSKTAIDEILANRSAIAPFTWPLNREGQVISQEVLPVIE